MSDTSPLSALIDFGVPYPNLRGVPLWMSRKPLPDDTVTLLTLSHSRGRAAVNLATYADLVCEMIPAQHQRLICDALTDGILNDTWDDIAISTPPGSAKSSYAVHAFVSWFMGRFPGKNAIVASHTASLAEKWNRRVRDTVASPAHQNVFPASNLSKDSTSVTRWTTSQGGECLAAGVGMSILGFRADVAVIDDAVSGWEQAQSQTQLQKIHDWYESDLKSRLKPGGKVIHIGQRTSANDLIGYVIARHEEDPTRRLRVIRLPMVVTHDDLPDPLGRQIGDRLWPEWYTQEMVADLRKNEFIWKTMYQQRPPSEEGSWIDRSHIRIVQPAEFPPQTALKYYLLTDLALSVNKGDYSVHVAVGVDAVGHVWVDEAWRDRCAIEDTVARHLAMVTAYAPQESLIDDDNAAKVYVQLLAAKARQTAVPVPWKTMPMRGQDKETRAAALRGLFRTHRISLRSAPWNEWLVRELLTFPNAMGSGVDDGVDALSLIGRRLASLARPAGEAPPRPPVKTWQDVTLNEMWEERECSLNRRRRL